MRNKLIAFSLLFVFAANALATPGDSACYWVDKEALAALGLANTVAQVAPQGTGTPKAEQCTFSAPNAALPSLKVSVEPSADNSVLKPVCQWTDFQMPTVGDVGVCFMKVENSNVSLTLMTEPPSPSPSASTIQATLSAHAERLYNKHLESAAK
jgi:hypothetical protein